MNPYKRRLLVILCKGVSRMEEYKRRVKRFRCMGSGFCRFKNLDIRTRFSTLSIRANVHPGIGIYKSKSESSLTSLISPVADAFLSTFGGDNGVTLQTGSIGNSSSSGRSTGKGV